MTTHSPHVLKGLLTLCMLCALTACDPEKSAPVPTLDSAEAPPVTPSEPRWQDAPSSSIVVSHSARLPATPARLISLAPNITELVFALGAGDRLVGVTRFCDYPPQVKALPRIGGFIDPDLEAILAQSPDLVLGMKAGDAALVDKLDGAALPHVFLEMNDLDQTRQGILVLGELLGVSARARELAEQFEAGLRPVQQTSARPRTLFLFGHDPMIASGHGTFAHELLERAGAQNALNDTQGAYPQLDMEFVLKLNPEVIIDTTMTTGGEQEMKAFWAPYTSLLAQQHDRIITINDPSFLRPGPRLPDALARLKAIYAPDDQAKEAP